MIFFTKTDSKLIHYSAVHSNKFIFSSLTHFNKIESSESRIEEFI